MSDALMWANRPVCEVPPIWVSLDFFFFFGVGKDAERPCTLRAGHCPRLDPLTGKGHAPVAKGAERWSIFNALGH